MAELVEITRCKDCKYHNLEQEPEHGKTIHFCSVLNAEVFKDFYCYHGTPKERGEGVMTKYEIAKKTLELLDTDSEYIVENIQNLAYAVAHDKDVDDVKYKYV